MSQKDSIETCFLCLDKVMAVRKGGRKSSGRGNGNSRAKFKFKATQGPKILLGYVLETMNSAPDASALENHILSAYKTGRLKMCHNCETYTGRFLQLHLELEEHQLKIIDLLKKIQFNVQNSPGMKAWKGRLKGKGNVPELKGTKTEEGTLLEVFQDMVRQKFLPRKLSDGNMVCLETLENFRDRLRKTPDETDELETKVKEEPEDSVDNNEDYYNSPPPSSPLNHDAVDDDDPPSPTRDATIPGETPKDVAVDNPVDPSSSTEDFTIKRMGAAIEIVRAKSTKESNLPSDNRKRKIDDDPTPVYKSDSDFDEDNDPLQDVANDDNDEDYDPKMDVYGFAVAWKTRKKKSKETPKQSEPLPEFVPWTERYPPPHPRNLLPRIKKHKTKTRWACDICLEWIPFKQMKDHLQTHPQFEKFYFCHAGVVENRKKVFGTFKGYVWHLQKHSCKTGSTLECALCSDHKSFLRKDLPKHLYEDHQLDHPRPTCSDCSKEFYDPRNLRRHKLIEHARLFMCEYCSRSFESQFYLKEHITYRHNDATDKKYFQCAFCPRRFCSSSSVKYHEARVHIQDSLNPCPHCGKAMIESHLREHIKVVHGEKKYICRFCSKGFTRKCHLDRHEESHIGEPKYKCPECPYAATTRTYLSRHVQIHGEPKFACEFCPKRFTLKRYWEDHLRTHTKEKPYQCDICLMSFNARNCLSSHRKKKHGLTPQARSLLEREALSSTGATLPGNSESVTRENLEVKQDVSITRQDMFILPDNPRT